MRENKDTQCGKPSLQDILEEEEEEKQLKAAKASSGGWFSRMFKVKR